MGCRPILVATVIVVVGCSTATRSFGESEPTIRALEQRRFAAMVERDVRALDTLFADDLTYTHTTGRVDTKAELLADLRAGRLVYDSIIPSDVRVRFYPGAAIATGTARMQVRAGPQLLRFSIRFTETYVEHDRRWQLAAWQSTRLPEP